MTPAARGRPRGRGGAVRRRAARRVAARRARRRGDQGRAAGRRRVPAGDAGCGRVSGATSSRSTVASARSCSISSPPPAAPRWRELVGTADVVIHNAPPPRAATFGLGWDGLHARTPGARRRRRDLVRPAWAAGRDARLRPRRPGALRPSRPRTPPRVIGCRCVQAGSRWPTSRQGICSRPACWRRSFARGRWGRGSSSRCRCSVLRSRCRSRISCGSRVRPMVVPPPRRATISRRAPTRSPVASR